MTKYATATPQATSSSQSNQLDKGGAVPRTRIGAQCDVDGLCLYPRGREPQRGPDLRRRPQATAVSSSSSKATA